MKRKRINYRQQEQALEKEMKQLGAMQVTHSSWSLRKGERGFLVLPDRLTGGYQVCTPGFVERCVCASQIKLAIDRLAFIAPTPVNGSALLASQQVTI